MRSSPRSELQAARDFGLAALAWAAVVGTVSALSPGLAGTDGYYHIRLASLGPGVWLAESFPWMRYGVLGQMWVDHQLLFHAFQWPFTWLFDLVPAAEIAASVLAAGAGAAFVLAARRLAVPQPWLFAAAALVSSPMVLSRLAMPRAQMLGLLALLVGFALGVGRRPWALAVLGFAFAWAYHTSVFLPLIVAATAVTHRDLRPAVYAGLGVGAGFAIHPQSPETFQFLWLHVGVKFFTPMTHGVAGGEWVPMSPSGLGVMLAVPVVVAGAGLALGGRPQKATASAGLVALVFVGLCLKSVRWAEYAGPFAMLAAAGCWAGARRPGVVGLSLLALAWSGPLTVEGQRAGPSKLERLAGVAAHLPKQECRVFHSNWADFSELFFHAPQCRYIVGLDPIFLETYSAELTAVVRDIAFGRVANVGTVARDVFDSDWVVCTSPYLRRALEADSTTELIYEDGSASLWRVVPIPRP